MKIDLQKFLVMLNRNRPVGDPNRIGWGVRRIDAPKGKLTVIFAGPLCLLTIDRRGR